jgi:hypothetical protein
MQPQLGIDRPPAQDGNSASCSHPRARSSERSRSRTGGVLKGATLGAHLEYDTRPAEGRRRRARKDERGARPLEMGSKRAHTVC